MASHMWVLKDALKSLAVGRIFPESQGTIVIADCEATEHQKQWLDDHKYAQTQAVAFVWFH